MEWEETPILNITTEGCSQKMYMSETIMILFRFIIILKIWGNLEFKKRKQAASLKYYSDGSGRDSYVLHESGGLEKNHKSLNEYQLKDFLRYSLF